MTLAVFAAKWSHPDYPPDKVEADSLEAAQTMLGARFPADYVTQVLETGLPRPTITLLDAVAERDIDLHTVNDFFAPDEIVSITRDSRGAGTPDTLVVFADDPGGNLFCFHVTEPGIWFFDHELITTNVIAGSFSDWIDAMCAIEPVADA